ncbi:Protein CBG17441 [Caenorhabditis briggsae]|uniref:Protein CBG17441 n=1 Tax=Caenorhabditis briggsae TaxID=6238 RepID=A8XR15_CAEBR|nr:Protein CBG17441 [Caenorhabditis briggsae]CAP35089.1 Protein CBG17441 [Caenorhabditis briggsae]
MAAINNESTGAAAQSQNAEAPVASRPVLSERDELMTVIIDAEDYLSLLLAPSHATRRLQLFEYRRNVLPRGILFLAHQAAASVSIRTTRICRIRQTTDIRAYSLRRLRRYLRYLDDTLEIISNFRTFEYNLLDYFDQQADAENA